MPEKTYDNRDSFILFPNERMREGKRDPEWTGTLYDADGNEFWMSMWEKSGAKGDFFTGSFRKKEARPDARPRLGQPSRSVGAGGLTLRRKSDPDDLP